MEESGEKCIDICSQMVLAGEPSDVCSSVAARNCQISSLHSGSQTPAVCLPHPSTMSETEETLFCQLTSGRFALSGSSSVLNPNKVSLTVHHKTREVLYMHLMTVKLLLNCNNRLAENNAAGRAYSVNVYVLSFQILSANEQACKLFQCASNELIGRKLSSVLKKTSQVLEQALEEDFPLVDGTVAAVSGKVV